jgi:hypothetical protein
MTDKKQINFHGINTVAVNYKGVQIIQNSLINNGWLLFFSDTGKYKDQSPFCGTLKDMKGIINDAIKIGKGGEKHLLQADTY